MEKFPLTTPGTADWQAALKNSPAPVVEEQAFEAESDFKPWLKKTFLLNQEQQEYLEGLDDELTDHWGTSVAFFIRNGLPIVLIKPEESPVNKSAKLVLSKEELQEDQGMRAAESTGLGGTLTFTITY